MTPLTSGTELPIVGFYQRILNSVHRVLDIADCSVDRSRPDRWQTTLTNRHSNEKLLLVGDDAAFDCAWSLFDAARHLEPDPDFERSVKFNPEGVDYNRFLIGIDAHRLTAQDLEQICQTLAMPASLSAQAMATFDSPSTLLLGFEQQPDKLVYKLYFEFWDQVIGQVHGNGNPQAPILLNVGFKWNIDAPQQNVITRYTCLPLLDVNRILGRMREFEDVPGDALDACLNIVTRAAGKLARPTFVYMEADEDGERRSFDLNLYSADIEIGDAAAELAAMTAAFDLAPDCLDTLNPCRFRILGHLSAGTDRSGRPFVTIYFEDDLPERAVKG